MPDRYSLRIPAGVVPGILLATSSALFYVTAADAAGLKIQRIRIESNPAGAEVSTIVGKHGVTPLSITERDIYPNTYPDAKLNQYGKVIISKPGCKTITRSVTLDDIKHGLDIQLDCSESTPVATRGAAEPEPVPVARSRPVNNPPAALKPARAVTPVAEPLSGRRLRQLQVLNELLDDGLISAEEERAIRNRIFERLDQY